MPSPAHFLNVVHCLFSLNPWNGVNLEKTVSRVVLISWHRSMVRVWASSVVNNTELLAVLSRFCNSALVLTVLYLVVLILFPWWPFLTKLPRIKHSAEAQKFNQMEVILERSTLFVAWRAYELLWFLLVRIKSRKGHLNALWRKIQGRRYYRLLDIQRLDKCNHQVHN